MVTRQKSAAGRALVGCTRRKKGFNRPPTEGCKTAGRKLQNKTRKRKGTTTVRRRAAPTVRRSTRTRKKRTIYDPS